MGGRHAVHAAGRYFASRMKRCASAGLLDGGRGFLKPWVTLCDISFG